MYLEETSKGKKLIVDAYTRRLDLPKLEDYERILITRGNVLVEKYGGVLHKNTNVNPPKGIFYSIIDGIKPYYISKSIDSGVDCYIYTIGRSYISYNKGDIVSGTRGERFSERIVYIERFALRILVSKDGNLTHEFGWLCGDCVFNMTWKMVKKNTFIKA